MNKSTVITLLVILLLVALAGFVTLQIVGNDRQKVNEQTKQIFTDESEDFFYTDVNGVEISLEQYLGKVLVVMSWASWSPFSANDLKEFNNLAGNYNREEVVFIAINRKETKEMAERFLNTQPEFKNILLVLDPTDNFYNAVGGYAMPETVIFDERGEVSSHIKGVANIEDVENQIEILINSET